MTRLTPFKRTRAAGACMWLSCLALMVSFLPTFALQAHAASPETTKPDTKMMVAGYLEKVGIKDTPLAFRARLDSGATLSSLNALDLTRFKRDDQEWVRFKVVDPNDDKKRITLEYPVERNIRIVQHSGNHQLRPVIELTLCIGQHQRRAEVSLVDRSEFTYQLLVGRNHMRGALLIDPGQRYLHDPSCGHDSPNS